MPQYIAVSSAVSRQLVRGVLPVIVVAFLSAFILAATCDSEPDVKPITLSDLATIDARVDSTVWAQSWATRQASEKRIATLEAQATRSAISATSAAIAQPSLLPPRRVGDSLAPSNRQSRTPWRSNQGTHPSQPNPLGVWLTATARATR